jgi:DNA-directed RNA polymerase subunit RPC12/RpoP
MTDIFDVLSHTDFLKLTLEAFSRQDFGVERSNDPGADAVLVSKSGTRIAVLCKKYRGAFIGRPVLQQFHAAMGKTGCSEGYLIATTDCLQEAREFAKGKGLDLYNRDRTTRLFKTAFGDEFMRTGKIPELGQKARAVPAPVRKPASVATYEKVPAPDRTMAREPAKLPAAVKVAELARIPEPPRRAAPIKPPEPVKIPEPIKVSASIKAPELVKVPEPIKVSESVKTPEPVTVPEPIKVAEPIMAPKPAPIPEQQQTPPKAAVQEKPPEAGQAGENIAATGDADAVFLENTTTIVCAECNRELRVPTDQGMVKVACDECGLRWIFQPETKNAEEEKVREEVKPITILICQTCKQRLSVPNNRGQLNVKCPKCKVSWLFTP